MAMDLEKPVSDTLNMKSENTNYLVSVYCITYNHEPFINSAIEVFLKQKTKNPIEIIIHSDASTDKNADIIRMNE
jgi:glycosyltransferase involved in cell wall biosynthesis